MNKRQFVKELCEAGIIGGADTLNAIEEYLRNQPDREEPDEEIAPEMLRKYLLLHGAMERKKEFIDYLAGFSLE